MEHKWLIPVSYTHLQDLTPHIVIKFPTPLMVINAFYELRFTVLNHIGATMFRVLTGFLVGSIAGIGFGLFMGLNPSVNKYLNPLVESSRPCLLYTSRCV